MNPFTYAQAQHERPTPPTKTGSWVGYCLVFVRSCFGVGARYGSASEAWRNAQHRHAETDPTKIPRGVPVFWTGGSHGYGHVALTRGGDSCWTTDFVRRGGVDVAPISAIGPRWGMTLVGWTEDLNGVRLYTPPATAPRPKPVPKPKRYPNVGRMIAAGDAVTTKNPKVRAAVKAALKALSPYRKKTT